MKCFYHPKEDALAICKSCGRGVCQQCLVILAGDSYCKACVETGRVKAPTVPVPIPPVAAPRPSGVPSRAPFIVGGVGTIISGVAALLSLFGGFGNIFAFAYYAYGVYLTFGFGSILFFIMGIILGVGLLLAGIGYLGIKRNYGPGTGTAGFAFSIVACVFLFASVAFSIIGLSYPYYYPYYPYYPYYNPWYTIFISTVVITLILFGVMQILWGAAHINSRQFTGNSGLTLATGIMLIISGALTACVILAFIGMILFFVSEILATIVFLISNIPQPT